jgi:putative phosphoribosyl transferase
MKAKDSEGRYPEVPGFLNSRRRLTVFKNRKEAGMHLAEKLGAFADQRDVLVLALPRGGVVTGAEIAGRLNAPLDVLIVRKIGHPFQPELAAGAISETGSIVYNDEVIAAAGVTKDYLRGEAARHREEIARRRQLYRGGQKIAQLRGKTVILVDDGVATGATMKAAVETLRREQVGMLVAAVPVAPPSTAAELERMVDVFVYLDLPADFMAVGNYYDDFRQVTDEEVTQLLKDFRQRAAA